MKSSQLQAQFIRKREIEQQKIQNTENVRRYYDKWGRITSLHEHWSSPEFYRGAEEKRKLQIEAEEKQKELEKRREILREKLAEEKRQFELELKSSQRPRIRRPANSVLESVKQNLEMSADRNRADLESQLYSRWRLGLDHEKILKDSKNTHQAIAKLSWLDRQIENQMKNEEQKQNTQKLELELVKEHRKHEEYVQNCQQMRESEINQLKMIQESNINELKLRERELNDTKLMESTFRKKLGEIQKEIENITSINNKRRDRIQALHNFRKIKMLMRERCDTVKRDLTQDLNLLDRISFDKEFDNNEEIKYLRQKFLGQYDVEAQNLKHIECMYESEAKEALKKYEEKWNEEAMLREQQLKILMDDRIQTINDRINECVRKHSELSSIRETHAKTVEDCSKRLKDLMSESLTSDEISQLTFNEPKTNDDNNISVNGGERNASKSGNNFLINGQHYEYTAPKFGRKKVAWT